MAPPETLHRIPFLVFFLAIASYRFCSSTARPLMPMSPSSRMLVLVPTPAPSLSYHGGLLLTAPRLRVHLLFYGSFSVVQQAAVTDFIASFQAKKTKGSPPSVANWWKPCQSYKDSASASAAARIKPGVVFSDSSYSKGKNLSNADLAALVDERFAANKKTRTSSVYAVITADDVLVEDFCMNSCGTHSVAAKSKMPFIWVGNAGKQCPGLCAWPFAVAEYGPPGPPLLPPSGDVAADGIIINLAMLLAGTVTNPFNSGYFEGDASIPVEAGSACQGKFGEGSYPGFAGKLLTDKSSGASYNYVGLNARQFLLPALWNPSTGACQVPHL